MPWHAGFYAAGETGGEDDGEDRDGGLMLVRPSLEDVGQHALHLAMGVHAASAEVSQVDVLTSVSGMNRTPKGSEGLRCPLRGCAL